MKILWLRRRRVAWWGQYSGYDRLCLYITQLYNGQHRSIWEKRLPLSPIIRRICALFILRNSSSQLYTATGLIAELKTICKVKLFKYDLIHIMAVENNYGLLSKHTHRLCKSIIGTVHQPASWWRMFHSRPETISSLDELILLSSHDVAFFEQYLPGRVHFIPHGIDTDFFSPLPEQEKFSLSSEYPRCVFSGHWLRDLQTLSQVIDNVIKRNPHIRFDMIVPKNRRHNPDFFRIARHNQVSWYGDISDLQLRDLYRQADMLVLPFLDSTANNALLEAMACGLPIISNAVGGVPDYTHNSFAELLPVGDVDGFVKTILRLADDPDERIRRGQAARSYALQNFAWEKIALQTLRVYKKALNSRE